MNRVPNVMYLKRFDTRNVYGIEVQINHRLYMPIILGHTRTDKIDVAYLRNYSYDFTEHNGVDHLKIEPSCTAYLYPGSDIIKTEYGKTVWQRKMVDGSFWDVPGFFEFEADYWLCNIKGCEVQLTMDEFYVHGYMSAPPLIPEWHTFALHLAIDESGNLVEKQVLNCNYSIVSNIRLDATQQKLSKLRRTIRKRLFQPILKAFEEDIPASVLERAKYFACKDAIKHLDAIGINWYENAANLTEGLKGVAKSYMDVVRSTADTVRKLSLKDASNTYLGVKYGITNDVRDALALKESAAIISSFLNNSTLYQHGKWNLPNGETLRATVTCNPFYSGVMWTELLGITPSPSKLWACVPFSFAVDWVLKCGDNLEEIEMSKMWSENVYHILAVTYSRHISKDVATDYLSDLGVYLSSEIKTIGYFRWSERYAPDFVYEKPDYFNGFEDHFIEAGALAYTNLK